MNWNKTAWDNREDYIMEQAETFDIPLDQAEALADLLGDTELFDGFITGLEDLANIQAYDFS